MAGPFLTMMMRWALLGFAASVGWKLGEFVCDAARESLSGREISTEIQRRGVEPAGQVQSPQDEY